ncbi:hypothetical protein [Nocardiopsis dassonvillei]|uniref:PD-(D/E)XK endonuclease-like domain-containing protein n=1 Tax=Nocardiopsis dassonvillei (strain ATCC 23218 / DSM 43111 / CIP 107115 / JCM 7437 / KCTC 9190 / NBRC 14626 / NCTC 10488 / NRRL B-5397 / IMRU 509) TaxID=446468 RepID=D7AXW7_NOCDD|nr:hypothetical protein [Nocardiopsis dassonvillei]ADH68021.1 conserved hypothetical protein [Nocardiopsis dassonvillei subsp. dassonvillei DSM 43111]VEI88520.1 Uncharacterised protein [Nocardiopsis dassonvillei]
MPDHTTGEPVPTPTVRVFSGSAALAAGGCPAHRRFSADPSLGADPPPRDTPGAVLEAVLDLVEHAGMALEEACARLSAPRGPGRALPGGRPAPPHPGLLVWVRHAARCYLEALAGDGGRDGPHRAPVFDFWVRQYLPVPGSPNSRPYELCARGRRYAYAQGSERVRELRIPVAGAAGGQARPRAEVAVAAYVLATGTPVDRDACAARPGRYRGGTPYPMRGHRGGADARPPDRVRVVETSCLDSSTAVLYDGSAAEAGEAFASTGREGLRSALVGGARSPGRDCLACAGRRGCGRLPRAPGLLGTGGGPWPRRSWSVSLGLRHRGCPARAHFHALGLPADPGAEPARLRRDRAVRAWLERLHRRLPRRPCTAGDLPGDRSSWSAGRWRLEGGQARLGAAMIAAHVGVCPLRGLASGSHVRVGHRLAADDTRADVLVLARAEVLHHRGRSWVHRSVTTTDDDASAPAGSGPAPAEARPSPGGNAPCRNGGAAPALAGGALFGDEEALLAAEPRLALAVGLFACGALPAGPDSAVELEVLSPRGASVRSLDPGSARVRALARRVVHELAGPWHGDTSHPPAPGEACLDCPYRRWCPAAGAPDALHTRGARARNPRGGAGPGPVRDPPPGRAAGSPSSAKR